MQNQLDNEFSQIVKKLPKKSVENKNTILAIAIFFCVLAIPLFFSSHSLNKGQVIKQFFAYSITESLAKNLSGGAMLETTIPCIGTDQTAAKWVEEPPVFHLLAALGLKLFPNFPALVPWLSFLLLGIAFSWFLESPVWAGLALLCPIFLRYSIQHLPDLLATGFLTLGAAQYLKRGRSRLGLFLFMLAITTKGLTAFPVLGILFWDEFFGQGKAPERLLAGSAKAAIKKGIWIFATLAGLCLPFALWLVIIQQRNIPSPFTFSTGLENSHTGSFSLLLSLHYFERLFTWLVLKGVGIFLFIPALAMMTAVVRALRLDRDGKTLLVSWILSILPYWIFVRQGNNVHDYYSLPFIPPLALLGVLQLRIWFTSRGMNKKLGYSCILLMLLSLVNGLWNLARLKAIPNDEQLGRPKFCDQRHYVTN